MKANTRKTGACVRKDDLFKCQTPEKMGESHPKAHLPILVQVAVFIRRERDIRTKKSRGGG